MKQQKKYCVWCGTEHELTEEVCSKCGQALDAKENLFKEFIIEHTKDKFKGDLEDTIYEALKNFLRSHLFSSIISVSFVVTAATALVSGAVTPDVADHIEVVEQPPAVLQEILGETAENESESGTQESETEPEEAYVLTESDKEAINIYIEMVAAEMKTGLTIGGYRGWFDYMWSEELEIEAGVDYYLDIYDDIRNWDIVSGHLGSQVCTIDPDTWTTVPTTVVGARLAEMGYTVAEVEVGYEAYSGEVPSEDTKIGAARYLTVMVVENDSWWLVSMINQSHYPEERGDAFV